MSKPSRLALPPFLLWKPSEVERVHLPRPCRTVFVLVWCDACRRRYVVVMPSLCRRFDGFEFVVVVLGSNVRAVSQFFTRGRGPVHSFLPAKLNDCCNGSANGVDIMHQQDGEGQHHSDVNPPLGFSSSTVFGVEERSTPPLILLNRYDHKTATPPHKPITKTTPPTAASSIRCGDDSELTLTATEPEFLRAFPSSRRRRHSLFIYD